MRGEQILGEVIVWKNYARYLPEENRRETFSEIIDRYLSTMYGKFPEMSSKINHYGKCLYEKRVLPSMRMLQFSGGAVERNEARGYNCCALPVDSHIAFSEAMFLLLSGCGVGFSVREDEVDKIPCIDPAEVKMKFKASDHIEGWSECIRALLEGYLGISGYIPEFDLQDIRPKGAELVTSGGKAPGPKPLRDCLDSLEYILSQKKRGEKLSPIECHDMMCIVADAVLAGGIRRSALISIFDPRNPNMVKAKDSRRVEKWVEHSNSDNPKVRIFDIFIDRWYRVTIDQTTEYGLEQIEKLTSMYTVDWWVYAPYRARANNSGYFVRGVDGKSRFEYYWKDVSRNRSGEPGIFFTNYNSKNRYCNPCVEVSLEAFQFCNLCDINAAKITNQREFNEAAEAASFFGTLQAGFTNFHYLRPIWKKTTERGRLIGVGITGVACNTLNELDVSEAARVVVRINEEIAGEIGIGTADRCTVIKPSGSTSSVLGCSSGIHAWHSKYYLRTIRVGKSEKIYEYFKRTNPELTQDCVMNPETTGILCFPIQATDGGTLREGETAIDFLDRVMKFNREWVQAGHRRGGNFNNVSATLSVKEHEWDEVGKYLWENRRDYTGMAVLPYDGGNYMQAPFQELTKEQYDLWVSRVNPIDLRDVREAEDLVNFGAIAACAGGSCDIL